MKKIITTFALLLSVTIIVSAQNAKKEESDNCFLKWQQKLESRGAEEVADGIYTDVIITFRSGSDAKCYNGKCEVKEGKIISMFLKKEDGSYELVKKKLRYEFPVTILNGISKPVLTLEDELINVLFVKKILPKKAGFEKAAEPTDD